MSVLLVEDPGSGIEVSVQEHGDRGGRDVVATDRATLVDQEHVVSAAHRHCACAGRRRLGRAVLLDDLDLEARDKSVSTCVHENRNRKHAL